MKPNRDRDLNASLTQGEEVYQGVTVAQEVHITVEEDSGMMATTKTTLFQLLPIVF